ncbi:MAG: hypothetical protein U9N34_10510, partial [Candidatus Cloacimonadota bacterium]|nr:hypothetical protein [Candidatus Cloacimonadota bacterium]
MTELIAPLLLQYAEVHYRIRFLKPRYYRELPEIIADLPKRVIQNRKLPVLIIVKDSDKFPIELHSVIVYIHHTKGILKKEFYFQKSLSQRYYSNIFFVDLKDLKTNQNLVIIVKIKTKKDVFFNDNYLLEPKPFSTYYSEDRLVFPKNWFCGDSHYHSNFTSDQVEFGADIFSTKIMAKAMGLDWFFVTDHSYDLDDVEDDFLRNDPNLPKWEKMKAECKNEDEEDFRVIFGEEISIGNSCRKNVHLLAINNKDFFEGKGDGAEKWFKNKPDLLIEELKLSQRKDNLFIAAHPAEKVPLSQKLTLRRGSWSSKDFENGNIEFGQFINSDDKLDIQNGITFWKSLLLEGKHISLIAGNDAHGNFNSMRQIKSPFLNLFRSKKQIFGNFMTVFFHTKNDPIAGFKNRKLIVSNGPFLDFKMGEFEIGDIADKAYSITFEAKTSEEFGKIKFVKIHVGNFITKKEK